MVPLSWCVAYRRSLCYRVGSLEIIRLEILSAIEDHARAKCGYASVTSTKTLELTDEMPSYFLAETTKYLFLLYDEVHAAFPRHTCGTRSGRTGHYWEREPCTHMVRLVLLTLQS